MANWDEKILAAADKISKGIEKGSEFVASLRTPNNTINLQTSQNDTKDCQKARHCPSCGHIIGTLDLFCPSCGTSLEESKASSAAEILANNLVIIDSQKEGLIRNLVRNHNGGISDKATQKATMIKSFPVPNTKKDILEFMHMAASSINSKLIAGVPDASLSDPDIIRTEKLLSQTWLEKMDNMYLKAKTLLSDDSDLAKIEALYFAKKSEINSYLEETKKNEKKALKTVLLAFIILLLGSAVLLYFLVFKPHQDKIRNLNELVVEIQQEIEEGHYGEALLLTNRVRLNDGFSSDADAEWNHKREELISKIEKSIGSE